MPNPASVDAHHSSSGDGLRLLTIGACLVMFIAHLAALSLSDGSAVRSPISQLSRGDGASVHTAGLIIFGLAHLTLAAYLGRLRPPSWMWRIGVWLTALNGLGVIGIAAYFVTASDSHLVGPGANDPLSVLASSVGFAMGLLIPGLRHLSTLAARFNYVCLALWLALVPLILLLNASWFGAYERMVGAVLVGWVGGIALLTNPDTPAQDDA